MNDKLRISVAGFMFVARLEDDAETGINHFAIWTQYSPTLTRVDAV